MSFLPRIAITDDIIDDTNNPEPIADEAAKYSPLLDVASLSAADNEEKRSGAPFPKAKRVTP